ncbi:TPA: thioredoxin fold domain-containing protein [Salmonella enterica subsp. enterica serovar Potsdam]
MHDSKTQSPQEIYHAETPEQAAILLKVIQEERQRRYKSQKNFLLSLLMLVMVILFGFAVLTTANSYISAYERNSNTPQQVPAVSRSEPVKHAPVTVDIVAEPPAVAVPQKSAPVAQAIPSGPEDSRAIRAASLKKATDSGRYTINLSGGRARTIYVFSDPFCPGCRQIEPTLEALTRDYNVVIFPVTLVGKQKTTEAVAPVLCAAPQKRAQLWQSLFKADGVMSLSPTESDTPTPTSCTDGEHAIAINDRAFDYYQLPGTPQLIADDGRDIPFSALTSDDALARFMNTPVQGAGNDNR